VGRGKKRVTIYSPPKHRGPFLHDNAKERRESPAAYSFLPPSLRKEGKEGGKRGHEKLFPRRHR